MRCRRPAPTRSGVSSVFRRVKAGETPGFPRFKSRRRFNSFTFKAEEAGTRWHTCDTRSVKPSQRCACCGTVIKKTLDERVHLCTQCGFTTSRDRNAALVMLIDALAPGYWAALDRARRKRAAPADLARVSLGPYAAFIRDRVLYAQADFDFSSTAPGAGVDTDRRGERDSAALQGTGNPTLVP